MEHLSDDHEGHSNQHKNSQKQYNDPKVSHCEYDGKWMETETTTWSELPNGGKAVVEKTLVSEERN